MLDFSHGTAPTPAVGTKLGDLASLCCVFVCSVFQAGIALVATQRRNLPPLPPLAAPNGDPFTRRPPYGDDGGGGGGGRGQTCGRSA